MATLRDRIAIDLLPLGYREEPTPATRKYRVFLGPSAGSAMLTRVYVGRAGALRIGGTIRDSVPAGGGFRARVIAAGEKKVS
jgi:hypothetical protein